MAWAPGAPLLAVGTSKGNLQLHHVLQRRQVPILGKASKRIAAVVWGCDRTLALASLDKTVMVYSHTQLKMRHAVRAMRTYAHGHMRQLQLASICHFAHMLHSALCAGVVQ
jgi:hypothetical protein